MKFSIPNLPSDIAKSLQPLLDRLKEIVEVRNAQRGDPLEANPTFKDLLNMGLIQLNDKISILGKYADISTIKNWLSSTIPLWLTDNTQPSPPQNLTVKAEQSSIILNWSLPASLVNYSHTEIWRAETNNLSLAQQIATITGSEYVDSLPLHGVYFYWLKNVSKSGLVSEFNDVNGATYLDVPGNTAITYSFNNVYVNLYWLVPVSNVLIKYYQVSSSSAFDQSDILVTTFSNTASFYCDFLTKRFWVRAININDVPGIPSFVDVVVDPPSVNNVTNSFDKEDLILRWNAIQGSLPIDYFEISHGSSPGQNVIGLVKATTFSKKIDWGGNRRFWVRAKDSADNFGAAASIDVLINIPSAVSITTQVIDNNVLLYWNEANSVLPIKTYELRKGSSWNSAVIIGQKTGSFTTVFELFGGTYVYWLAAIDSAGNYGIPTSVTVNVNQPPDYVLVSLYDSIFAGTKSNCFNVGYVLYAPFDVSETWQSHFTSRSWNTPQDQINAGYPYFLQPASSSGYYEEQVDCGTVLSSISATVTANYITFDTGFSLSCDISVSTNGSSWTTFTDVFTIPPLSFRYLKYKLKFTSNNKGFAYFDRIQVKLDAKQKSVFGDVYCNASDSGGTIVYLTTDKTPSGTKVFVDVQSIVLTPAGTTPIIAIYDFVDVPYPLSFKILLYNTSGARVSGVCSYNVRGV